MDESTDAPRGPTIRRKHGERVRVKATEPGEIVITLRVGRDVVLDCEPLPSGWEVSRDDKEPT